MEDLHPENAALLSIMELLDQAGNTPSLASMIEDRKYPVFAPDSTPSPYLVFSQLDEETISTKDGEIPNGWSFQVSVYADTVLHAKKIARAVRRAINGKEWNVEGVSNMFFRFNNELDDYNEKRELVITSLEFRAFKIN
jgi:hypothetical protein